MFALKNSFKFGESALNFHIKLYFHFVDFELIKNSFSVLKMSRLIKLVWEMIIGLSDFYQFEE